MSSSGSDGSIDRAASFAEALPALKQHGCGVLIVGTVPEEVHEHACQRLLGDDTAEPRRRLMVRASSGERLGADPTVDSDATPWVIEHAIDARASAVEADSPGGQGFDVDSPVEPSTPIGADAAPGVRDATDNDGLSGLEVRISAAIEEIEASARTLSPAELRVCFDSLFALVDVHDRESVSRLLRSVLAEVREARGMVHCHLPVARSAEIVDAFESLFDAVIELRVEHGRLQQRWYLQGGPSSEWLPLRSPTTGTRGG